MAVTCYRTKRGSPAHLSVAWPHPKMDHSCAPSDIATITRLPAPSLACPPSPLDHTEPCSTGTHCSVWLAKKQRYCRWPVLEHQTLCGHHSQLSRRRCEWCTTLISSEQAARHELRCPAAVQHRARLHWPFFVLGCNLQNAPALATPSSPPCRLSSASPAQLQQAAAVPAQSVASGCPSSLTQGVVRAADVVIKLRAALATCPPLPAAIYSPDAAFVPPASTSLLCAPVSSPRCCPSAASVPPRLSKSCRQRHQQQCSALLQLMLDRGLLTPGAVVVELGAGKAGLSRELVRDQRCVRHVRSLVLVDSSSFKNRGDAEMKAAAALPVSRYQMDIAHFSIARLPQLGPPAVASAEVSLPLPHAVVIAKHLCGSAMDLAIRAVVQSGAAAVSGACLATCCHHRCSAESYCNPAFLSQHGIREAEFALLCRMSSWACNDEHVEHSERRGGDEAAAAAAEHETQRTLGKDGAAVDWTGLLPLSWEARCRIGREAKWLLDQGRVQALQRSGYDAELRVFVSELVTRENVALMASRRSPASAGE